MNGYINIDFNGQPIGLKFGYNSVKWFATDCDTYYEEYFENINGNAQLTATGLASLIHSAYRNNQLLKRQEATIELIEVYDWVVSQNDTPEGQAVLKAIDDVYNESREVKLFIQKLNEATDDLKKKTQEAILNGSKS